MYDLTEAKKSLNEYLTYLNKDKNEISDNEVKTIRGNLIRVHNFMYNNIETLSKDDIKILIENIIEIERITFDR
ncbi:hypothetical protein [Mammaliicoccus sciuri]|uniref:hypothetical protein n=1 Tax=Mammaliicoccus sciuri TaxID=1296 RepID=UPI0005E6495D|nr:hypothetical protein [Mammaliicoccus sciuri]MCD8875563.1 hypothetical protein [Mammaliicoccus sciuri]MEB7846329.1 hypothetical protein [Mammaliicoccus sciuri]CPQ84196.1 Uncharacterised protein [Staphylococcus aureus]